MGGRVGLQANAWWPWAWESVFRKSARAAHALAESLPEFRTGPDPAVGGA